MLAEFAIKNIASESTLGYELPPFLIDRGAHPRLPLIQPHHDRTAGEAHDARRAADAADQVRGLLAAARCYWVWLRSKELLDARRHRQAVPTVGGSLDGAQGWQGRGGARVAGRQKAAPPAGARGTAKFWGRGDSKSPLGYYDSWSRTHIFKVLVTCIAHDRT